MNMFLLPVVNKYLILIVVKQINKINNIIINNITMATFDLNSRYV